MRANERSLIDVERNKQKRQIHWDEEIYALEQERIFSRCWLFLAHESLIPNPGDFFCTYMGEDSAIVTRDQNNQIRAFINSCTHRGARVCHAESGHTRAFVCPYHGWTFGIDGSLLSVPSERSVYGSVLDGQRGQLALQPVPRVETFAGFIFGNFDHNAPSLREYSLFAVVPPAPRVFQKQDIIQIIINETSIQKVEKKLDRKKEYDLSGSIDKLPDLVKLLELRLEPGDRSPLAEVGAGGESEFKGDGRVERKDQLSTRVSARIIEIKPNGLLLLEARKTVQSDDEITTVVVSGLCRPEDVTKSNTVQSTQLADLVIRVENEGEARNAARRGLIPRVLDTVFNF